MVEYVLFFLTRDGSFGYFKETEDRNVEIYRLGDDEKTATLYEKRRWDNNIEGHGDDKLLDWIEKNYLYWCPHELMESSLERYNATRDGFVLSIDDEDAEELRNDDRWSSKIKLYRNEEIELE